MGILALVPAASSAADVQAFRDELALLGYSERRNLAVEIRFANGRSDTLPVLAADLVRLRMDVIVTNGSPAERAAKLATATIPIAMAGSAGPVGRGLAARPVQPGVNVTGVTSQPGPELVLRQRQLLKQASPTISRVAIIKMRHPFEDAAFALMEPAGSLMGVGPMRSNRWPAPGPTR